ncbi:DUF2312 domain-containing protein [Tardiphaga sp. 709]|uniref:DUF2312 domain-containing protein n=1 Tax=Tardiphaga sp. 709 TaxID=3076039 RepID=UPI0028E1E212|nr:DUF2312 domain-containing protein [Tardiphaga sp. 709]WNV09974.1 DUF2312 domain-containing protein [Tardiphaga sp. 709]
MIGDNAKQQLLSVIERVERLNEDKKAILEDIREVFVEAKGNGYDVKALKTVIRMRSQDPNERAEQEALVESYAQALGGL